MPVWVFMYARSLTDQAETVEGPLGLGAEVYGTCASCHGGDGGGGVGYAFTGGSILATFPNIEDQLRYTYYGTGAYQLAGVEVYGNPDREGGPHITGAQGVMPQQGSAAGGDLTDYQILAVVCHERYALGGADPTSAEWSEEFETWCSEESEIFAGLQGGTMNLQTLESSVEGIIPIGMEPVPGSPASE
jgi:mono/diheme cytochrome c family protein